MRLSALLVALLALAAAPHASAQLSSLEPGDRVRLQLDSRQQLVGDVVSVTADSLTISVHPEAAATALPLTTVRSLAVSRGRQSVLRSALSGAAMGAALLGAQFGIDEGASGGELGKHAGWGATGGAALGFVLGSLDREEIWVPLSLPGRSVEVAEALRFPAFAVAGRWGPARGQAGHGSGEGLRVDAGLARLSNSTQLRSEFSAERSSTEGDPVAIAADGGVLTSAENSRRFSYGLTVVQNMWRIGEGVQTYASFGLGVTHSRVDGEMRQRCGPAYSCNVDGIAYGYDSGRRHRGTYALGGLGVVAHVQGVNVFVDLRSQMADDGGYDPGSFTPISLGISF